MDSTGDEERILHEGRWLRLKQRGSWEYAERVHAAGLAVIIIALTPDRKLVFVEQFRVPIQSRTIELPAGLVGDVDSDEALELAAERELLEETGWQAQRIDWLMTGPTSAGMCTERIAFVRASGLSKVHAGGGHEGEGITVHEVPLDDAARWLCAKQSEGYELDPKLWAGIWLAERELDGTALRV